MAISILPRTLVLAALLSMASVLVASAAGPISATPPTVHPSLSLPFSGTFGVSQTGQNGQMAEATMAGRTRGDLPLAFTARMAPAQYAGGRRGAPQSVLLKGSVTVQDPSQSTTWFQGDAQATLNNDGTGVLGIVAQGTGPYQGASLTVEMNYTVDDTGAVSGDLNGGMTGAIVVAGRAAVPARPVDHTYWYLSRAAGIIAYLLLCVSVLFGLSVKTKAGDLIFGRWRMFDLHQTAALTAIAFLLLHVFSLLGDQYFGFTISQLLVPFASPYRIVWIAVGIFSFYLALMVSASFYVRRWITYRVWRLLHYLTFLAFGLGLVHGIFAGTDTSETWVRDMYWLTGAAVALFTIYRMPSGTGESSSEGETIPRRGQTDSARRTASDTGRR